MTISIVDQILTATANTPLGYGWLSANSSNQTITCELPVSSSLPTLIAGNNLTIAAFPYQITLVGNSLRGGRPTQLFRLGTPTST